jgi:4-amino-4-deoxy-L-arabinose transferase-like glycosyltransferase
MLGILLIVDLMALALVVYLVRGQRDFLRESVLIGFVLWSSGVLASTEGFSLFHVLGFGEILIFWIMVLVFCLVFISRKWGTVETKRLFYPARGSNGAGDVRPWPFLEKAFFNRIVFFSFCLGVIALFGPPNSFDAMSYHMGRVMHWIQDRGVMYYPTNITRQLFYPAFAEYVILHFQLLSGGDYWANFIQWLAMCGSLIGVSLIARELGATRRGQIIAALIAVTIPIGILEATSTQTDYVDTLWLCSFVYFFFCWRRTLGWGYVLLIGATLGLDLATKGVALVYAMPFVGWMLIEAFRRMNIKKCLMMGGTAGCVALLLYLGILYRNVVYFHGQATQFVSINDSMINTRFCLEGFLANVLRNTGLHLITPSYSVNTSIKEGIYNIASFLHINLNGKDWSFYGATFDAIDFRGIEEYLGNPLHLLLFGAVLVLFAISPRFRNRGTCFYLAACFLGWVAFNAILKWQPYHSRFHLGLFVIFTPLAGFVLERVKMRWIVSGVMGAFFLSAWVIILINVSKPILNPASIFYPQDRTFLHFIRVDSPQSVYMEYEGIASVLKKMGCKNIGVIMGQSDLEYLLWVVLNPSADPAMRIESILVNNPTASLKYPLGDFVPDAIIQLHDDRSLVNWENNTYQEVWHNTVEGERFSILMKRP